MAENKETTGAEFIGNLIIRGRFRCITGLPIGGSKEKLEIGGVDSPVVRDPRTRYPYVPGSSLKGKMRSLLEYALGKVPLNDDKKKGEDAGGVSADPLIVRLFGFGVEKYAVCANSEFIGLVNGAAASSSPLPNNFISEIRCSEYSVESDF